MQRKQIGENHTLTMILTQLFLFIGQNRTAECIIEFFTFFDVDIDIVFFPLFVALNLAGFSEYVNMSRNRRHRITKQ